MDLTTDMLAPIGTYVTANLPLAFGAVITVVLTFAFVNYVLRSIKRHAK